MEPKTCTIYAADEQTIDGQKFIVVNAGEQVEFNVDEENPTNWVTKRTPSGEPLPSAGLSASA